MLVFGVCCGAVSASRQCLEEPVPGVDQPIPGYCWQQDFRMSDFERLAATRYRLGQNYYIHVDM